MSRRSYLSRRDKRNLFTIVAGLLFVFLLLVLVIPAFNVEAVVEGVDPTSWQLTHAWFLKVQVFFINYWFLFVLLMVVGYAIYKYLKRR